MCCTHFNFKKEVELFSVKCHIVVLCIKAYCVYPLARWTQILITRPTVVFSVPLTQGTLLHFDFSAYGLGRFSADGLARFSAGGLGRHCCEN